jgi:hypothetical protein
MPRDADASARRTDSVSRRGFLRAGSITFVGGSLALADAEAARLIGGPKRCVLIEMTGGPSHLDSFDPKPAARREIRGPLRAIATAIPGVQFSEGFPRLAEMADQLLVVRSLHHDAAAIHETGLQWIQNGNTGSRAGRPAPLESVVNQAWTIGDGVPAAVRLSPSLEDDGLIEQLTSDRDSESVAPIDPTVAAALRGGDLDAARRRYGNSTLALRLDAAHRLLKRGSRFITIPMFAAPEVAGSWDIHGHKPSGSGTAFDYGGKLGRGFDMAVATFLHLLAADGLLEETMVACIGEMGRAPKLNAGGGRDHWTKCWSAVLAGGGLPRGAVIGQSDEQGANPTERPVQLPELMASLLHQLGINPLAELAVGDKSRPLVGHRAMPELVG